MTQMTTAYPDFMRMVDLVGSQNPLQKKRVHNFIAKQSPEFWEYVEYLCHTLGRSFLKTEEGRVAVASAFNRMTMDFLQEQIRFKKTGVYLLNDATVARQNVYDRPEVMRYYMVGLFLSYMMWPNHYKMLHFYKEYLKTSKPVGRYLDVAPGHGLFTVETLQRFDKLNATLLDISETSIAVTKEILNTFQVDPKRIDFINGDFLTAPIEGGNFDLLTMGEVLEHVNDALGFMKRGCELIDDTGRIYMTTCTNAPAIDHIYHFHNCDEIRDLMSQAGLRILKEGVYPAEDVPEERCEEELITINYCAILAKK